VQNVGYNIHKTTGIVIVLLAFVRVGWRWAHPVLRAFVLSRMW
jgi:cytochrome b561